MANCNDTVALNDVTYIITPGEEEQLRLPSINEAWTQTIAKAVMATTEVECIEIMEEFEGTLKQLSYELICEERTALTSMYLD